MQREFYTSCIKINGIPLLPPLMTDSVKEEMKHYRSLAMKVEEKLKVRQFVKHTSKNKCVQADMIKPISKLKSAMCSSDSDISNQNTTSDTNNSDSYSKVTIVEHTPTMEVAEGTQDKSDVQSSMENIQRSQFQVYSTNNTVDDNSEPVATSSDQSVHVNATETLTPNDDVSSLESWKPEVPKTLDVIPITLGNAKCEEDNTYSVAKENENPPKLSRQGSYVLNTPSPILLAHMHTELTDKNYVPTPTTTNISHRKQWNIAQSKIEWKNEQFVVKNTEVSNEVECATHELSSRRSESDISIESYQTDKSATCTETVAPKEHTCTSNITPTKHDQVHNVDLTNKTLSEESKRNDITHISNLSNEMQESIGNENSPKTQLFHKENECHDKMQDMKQFRDSVVKAKRSIASEKLLTVYKEIQEMHRKQMMELIDRQRKEQSLLQTEFKKQQMLLLAEIQKCSARTPHQVDVSNISNQVVSSDEAKLEDTVNETRQQLNVNSPSNLRTEAYCNSKLASAIHTNVVVCPLDYISSKNLCLPEYYKSHPFITDASTTALHIDFAKKINSCDPTNANSNNNNNNNDNDDNRNCSYNRVMYKNSNVSRRLFPLDSNTTNVPILDTSAYLEKHVKAINIINAYVRGYLVRRLMRTERVITLKKIYKEALQCMLKLHVDAPLNLAEVNFLHRLQLQCDAASMNLVELFAQSPARKMKVIAQDREIKQSRTERPASARSYSFATQKTLARKNLKEFESTMTKYQRPLAVKKDIVRSRCQTWTSDIRDRLVSPNTLRQGIKRSTSAGTVRKPWR